MRSEIRKLGEHTPPACSVRRLAEPVCVQIVAQICNLFPQTRDGLAVGRALYFSNDSAVSAVAFPLSPALSPGERARVRASQFSNCIVPAEGEGQGGEHGPSRHADYGENSPT